MIPALTFLYTSRRKTLGEEYAGGFLLPSFTLSSGKFLKNLDASVSVYNFTNRTYGDPGAEDTHSQSFSRMAGPSEQNSHFGFPKQNKKLVHRMDESTADQPIVGSYRIRPSRRTRVRGLRSSIRRNHRGARTAQACADAPSEVNRCKLLESYQQNLWKTLCKIMLSRLKSPARLAVLADCTRNDQPDKLQ